jgi:hypothetical protein
VRRTLHRDDQVFQVRQGHRLHQESVRHAENLFNLVYRWKVCRRSSKAIQIQRVAQFSHDIIRRSTGQRLTG